jgi:hypothetical protein
MRGAKSVPLKVSLSLQKERAARTAACFDAAQKGEPGAGPLKACDGVSV